MHIPPLAAALVVLGPLVLIHELGHYWMARLVGVRVLAFSIGFGPVLWSFSDRHRTQWRISLVPLGGYVKMLDEREGAVVHSELDQAFNNKALWARSAVTLAGPMLNIVLAWVLYCGLAMVPSWQLKTVIGRILPGSPAMLAGMHAGETIRVIGDGSTDGNAARLTSWEQVNMRLVAHVGETGTLRVWTSKQGRLQPYQLHLSHFMERADDAVRSIGWVPPEPPIPPVIGSVLRGSPAEVAGIKKGDVLVSLDGQKLPNWPAWVDAIAHKPDQDLHVVLWRQSAWIPVLVHTERTRDRMGQWVGHIGAGVDWNKALVWPTADLLVHEPGGIWKGLCAGTQELKMVLVVTVDTLIELFRGHMSVRQLSGPIGIAHVASVSAAYGWKALLSFMALLSVSLGALNLLPVPVLDGGHLLYFLLEAMLGKPLSQQLQNAGVMAGATLMILLMIMVIFNDIQHFG